MTSKPSPFPLVERIEGDSAEGDSITFRVALTKAQLRALCFGKPPEVALREYLRALLAETAGAEDSWDPRI